MFLSSTKREIRHLRVVVVQRRLKDVQESVMHVQNCCFADIAFRSRCRHRRLCLSSLWCPREAGEMDYCYYFCWNTQWEPLGRRGTGLFLKRFPPFSPSASHITMKRRVFVAIMEGLGLGLQKNLSLLESWPES